MAIIILFPLLGLTLLPAWKLPNSGISPFDASLCHTEMLYACLEYNSIYCKNTIQRVILYFTKMQLPAIFCMEKKKYPLPLGSFLEKKTEALLGNRQHQIFVFWFMQAKRLQAFLPSVGANTHT